MLENIFSESVSILAELLKKRMKVYGIDFLYISQESLMTFLYVISLISRNPEIVDRVFIEYPFEEVEPRETDPSEEETGPREKFDIFIDVDPKYYVEVKYVRPFPSKRNLPLPRLRGSLINDIVRITCETKKIREAGKYLLLIASDEFINHISKKPGFPLNGKPWRGKINELIVVGTEKNEISNKYKEFDEYRECLSQEVELHLIRHEVVDPLHIVLWKVTTP